MVCKTLAFYTLLSEITQMHPVWLGCDESR